MCRTNVLLHENPRRGFSEDGMNETPQLASAMLTVLFAAVMLVAGHFYLESRSTTPLSPSPTTLKVSLR
jgi:hypothetical protein